MTLENPRLSNDEAVRDLTAEAREVLYTLVRDNPHPVSRALLEAIVRDGTPSLREGKLKETIGQGVMLTDWSLGRGGWRDSGPADGSTVLAWSGQRIAQFEFVDEARSDAREEIEALRRDGFETFILSGDQTAKVAAMAQAIGIPPDNAYGNQTPQAKAAWLLEHGPEDELMLGAGANDSLAFDAAKCRGTPVIHRGVLEQKADFYYLGQGLGGVRALFEVNTVRRQTQRFLLIFMIAYNLIAVTLAVAGMMNPLFAAVLMPLSSLATLAIVGIGMRRVW